LGNPNDPGIHESWVFGTLELALEAYGHHS
jgi:hypothetical protein